ncbi:MAG: hypothetical protein HC837_21595, partial [Chloroflexaceae bacterium]|nr:hypothetical protein [Chloroflexaceae bacterium]
MPAWQQWQKWNVGGIVADTPAAAAFSANNINCFVRGMDNNVLMNWWNGYGFNSSRWVSMDFQTRMPPATVIRGGRAIHLAAVGMNNQLYQRYLDRWMPNWSAWENRGGQFSSGPTLASWNGGRLDLFGPGYVPHDGASL